MIELNDYRRFMRREELHKALNSLFGILEGTVSDGVLTPSEQDELKNWYSLHRHLMNVHPFSEVFPLLDVGFSDDILEIDEVEDIIWLCNQYLDHRQEELYFDTVTCEIQRLEGTLHGMLADGELSDVELSVLNKWLNDHDFLCGVYPFDEVYGLLLAAKDDGRISDDERNMLKAYFSTFVDTRNSYNIHSVDVKALQNKYSIGGLCAINPEIEFKGKTFCFTGVSQRGTRKDFADCIVNHGGMFSDNITKKTDYLIVGGNGNPCWAYSCYGRKVEKAMQMRRNGSAIIIIHENDFWDFM